MPPDDTDGIDGVEERIGYRFSDRALLRRAFVHTSWRNENPEAGEDNERLEFLGDAALSLMVGHLLMKLRPEATEGELTRMRAAVVNEAALAEVAAGLRLGESLLLGRGEERSGGRRKVSLLADACEAVIGAVYLDGGFPSVLALGERILKEPLARALEMEGDPKSRLQRWAQARFQEPPSYSLAAQEGPDADQTITFEVQVSIAGREVARGRGRNKKEAEQRAAQAAIEIVSQEEAT